MSGDERGKERGALRRMLLTDESIRSAGLSSLGSASQATPLTEQAVAVETDRKHKKKKKKKHRHLEHDGEGKKQRKSATTATEDFDQNEMEGMLQQFETSTPTPTRSINNVSRSDRDLLNAMLDDQRSTTSGSTNADTSEHSSSSEKEQMFQSSTAPRVTASRNAHQFVPYQQATQALPFVTGGAMLRREPSKEALLVGSILHNRPMDMSTRPSHPSEGVSKETMMLMDVTSGPSGPTPQQPSRLEGFLRNITTQRQGPSKESMLMGNSIFTPRAAAAVVSAPSSRSIATAEGLSQSDLEAGGAEIDMAHHHTRSPSNSRSVSPIPTQTVHSAPGGFGFTTLRNYPRAEQPGAVAMEGRAFGLMSLPQVSRRECMRDEGTRHSSTTRSTLSLASFFSDGWDSVVQATAIEDLSVIVADVVSVKKMPRRCKIIVAICLFLLLVLAGVILGAFLSSARGDAPAEPTPAPTPMPTVQMDGLVAALADTISSTEDLTTPGTAQYKASFWLANQDLMGLSWTASPELVQRYVLLVLYYATQGEGGWRTQGGWLDPSRHECDWGPSISCNSDKTVVALDLSRNNVRGYIPSELKFLSKLEGLHLSENGVGGTIPDTIGQMTTLRMLQLNANKLTGTIPDFRGLFELSSLDLASNHLTGSLCEGFFELRQLRSVDLSFNRITGTVCESFGNLRFLSKVDLRNNRFSGSVPRKLMEIEDVAFLHLDNNELTGAFPLDYDLFLRKEKVTVSNNRLTGNPACPSDQENTLFQSGRSKTDDVRIREIDLSNNLFSGTISSSCGKLPTLQRLDLSRNTFHGNVHGFSGASSLEYLDFSRNTFDGPLPTDFATSLKYVDFSNNNLYGSIPQALLDLDNIDTINLSNNGISGTLPMATGGLLRYLNASNCDISGTLPEDYSELTSLEVLDLSGNRLGGNLPRQLDHLQNIRHIDLTSNVLTGQLPTHIGRMRELAVLRLSDNEISGTLPESIARLMNLEILYLDRNHMTGSVSSEVCSALSGLLDDPKSVGFDCNMECECCAKGVVRSCEEGLPKEDTAA